MAKEKILISIEIYTHFSKRVKIYSPRSLRFFYNYTALTREQYTDYTRTLQVVAKTVEDMNFQDKVSFKVRPWYLWFIKPFLRGAFRSPVVIIGKEMVSVGVVPSVVTIKEVLTKIDRKYRFLEKK